MSGSLTGRVLLLTGAAGGAIVNPASISALRITPRVAGHGIIKWALRRHLTPRPSSLRTGMFLASDGASDLTVAEPIVDGGFTA